VDPQRGQKGPRQNKTDIYLRETAQTAISSEISNAKSKDLTYSSVYNDSYHIKSFSPGLVVGDSSVRVPTFNADYVTDVPVTFYSSEVKSSNRPNFPMTFVRSNNPFKKNCAFSTDIRESNSKVAETHEKPSRLPIANDYRILDSLRFRLIKELNASLGKEKMPGSAVSIILASIFELDLSGTGKISLSDLRVGLKSSLGVIFAPEEAEAMKVSFCCDVYENISLKVLILYFKISHLLMFLSTCANYRILRTL
jgi:hypothetical protein